jgi:uncharacterized protein
VPITLIFTLVNMAVRNKKIVEKVIERFSTMSNGLPYDFLAEDIKWNIVGMPSISGKREFLSAVKNLQLENFSRINILKIIAEGDFVVVESSGRYSNSAYCDIYHLKNGKINELTTFIVDTSSSEMKDCN